MSIADILGTFDPFSAAVAIGFGVSTTIIVSTWMVRPSQRDKALDFEAKKMQIECEAATTRHAADLAHTERMAKLAADKDVQFRRIDTGMIELKPNS